MISEFDYVVVGAGSAGATAAARLSENGRLSVLLIEAGGDDRNLWFHIPLGVGRLLSNTRYVWPFSTEEEPNLFDTKIYWPCGKVVGGSSSVNGMVFVRGEPHEYDSWAALGVKGWSWRDLLPAFKRMEEYAGGDPDVRGQTGALKITDRRRWDPDRITDAFIESCMDLGIPRVEDYNDGTYEGVSYLQHNCWKGRRCSTASAYLRPAARRDNLKIELAAVAERILFEGLRAVGVEYSRGGETHQARARREVIVSAGAIQSPHLLELSGVGAAAHIRSLGIPVVADLPGVGENLIDHLQARCTYRCDVPGTINDLMASRLRQAREGVRYALTGRGLLGSSSSTAHAIVRTRASLSRPDAKIQLVLISGGDRYAWSRRAGIDPFPGFSIGVFPLRPRSRGSIHACAPDVLTAPTIRANYLSDPEDAAVTVAGLNLIRRIASRAALRRIGVEETRPGADVVADEDVSGYVRRTAQTSWHPVGTCRMGDDVMAVVDSRLRVRGLEGLRVVDASVAPTMPSSNTNALAVLIGERGAEFSLAEARGGQ